MNNGIASNWKDLVLVGNTLDKRVSLFRYEENKAQNSDHLIFLRTIDVGNFVDNIDYDAENKSFYLGVFPKLIDFPVYKNMIKEYGKVVQKDSLKGGVSIIREEENIDLMKAEMVYYLNELGAVSVACKFKDAVILGSSLADGISVCRNSRDGKSL